METKNFDKWFALKTEIEMAIISLMPFKDKESEIIFKAYHNVQQVMKMLEEKENNDQNATQSY